MVSLNGAHHWSAEQTDLISTCLKKLSLRLECGSLADDLLSRHVVLGLSPDLQEEQRVLSKAGARTNELSSGLA